MSVTEPTVPELLQLIAKLLPLAHETLDEYAADGDFCEENKHALEYAQQVTGQAVQIMELTNTSYLTAIPDPDKSVVYLVRPTDMPMCPKCSGRPTVPDNWDENGPNTCHCERCDYTFILEVDHDVDEDEDEDLVTDDGGEE